MGQSGRIPMASPPFIGRSMPRFEDRRLVSGKGRYTDDIAPAGCLHAVFVRSQHAAARILEIDATQARAMPGVVAILTGADYVAEGGGPIRHFADPADARDHTARAFTGRPGATVIDRPHLPMPTDRARYVGEPLALVVADTLAQAMDAAEAVQVEAEEMDFVLDTDGARAPGAPLVDPEIAANTCVTAQVGDVAAAEQALAASAHVIARKLPIQRIVNAQMEPRAVTVIPATDDAPLRMIAGSQGAVRQRDTLAACLGLDKSEVEVICPDVGGGFGPRTNLSPEQPLLAVAARKLGRAVRWTATRSEAFLTDYQGRDLTLDARLGLDETGRITGYLVDVIGNVGAYTVSFVPMSNSTRVMTGVYDIPVAGARVHGVLSNTVPTAPYRGAGRPEATYAIERLLDIAAARLGLDRTEIRRRNLISKAALPYRSAMDLEFDSGDFAANLDRVLDLIDWAGQDDRRAQARARGKCLGLGVASYIEAPVGIPHERIDITIDPAGWVEVVTGTQSTGQGHETTFAQVIADYLGVTPDTVRLISGDTRRVMSGGGTHSDRTMRLGGALLVEGTGKIVAQARAVLADHLGLAVEAVRFEGGIFVAGTTNRSFDIFQVARIAQEDAADTRAPLYASSSFTGRMPAYPTGAAACEVEVDPETGTVEITRYASVDDAGQPINPLILHGQVHGGIVQGLGQVFREAFCHDPTSGQVSSGSFMDYAMPRAGDFPDFAVELSEDPTLGNPLRVKGGGESGITPALATGVNAVVDALRDFGVEHIDMPLTPNAIWTAIQKATT